MTWYEAKFTAGTRAPIRIFLESESDDKKKVEERARRFLAAKTTLDPAHWDLAFLVVTDPPPREDV
jgi:hypothetical protein